MNCDCVYIEIDSRRVCKSCGAMHPVDAMMARSATSAKQHAIAKKAELEAEEAKTPTIDEDACVLPPKNIEYVKIPLQRGMTEIRHIWRLAKNYSAVIAGGYAKYCAARFVDRRSRLESGMQDLDIFPGRTQDAKGLSDEFMRRGYTLKGESEYSFTLLPPLIRNDDDPEVSSFKQYRNPIQVIKSSFLGNNGWRGVGTYNGFQELAVQVLSTFDMTIVRAAILDEETVLVDSRFWKDESENRINIEGFRNLKFLYHRIAKYASRRYKLNFDEIISLLAQTQLSEAKKQEVITTLNKIMKNPGRATGTYMNADSGVYLH